MYSPNKIIRSISLIGAFAFITLSPTARAVDPPPDGGYPNQNTAEGDDSLFSLTTGSDNTATGFDALYSNTTGFNNTANGFDALYSNTIGFDNTAIGVSALLNHTTGFSNTATGFEALYNNTGGAENTASGVSALYSNTNGSNNTAFGDGALVSNTIGNSNTANGDAALVLNTTGSNNTANGYLALYSNTSGSNNIAVGYAAGISLTTGSNNIDIGNAGVAGDSGIIRIGTKGTHRGVVIAGVSGSTVADGVAVVIGANGHLGTVLSSERYKEAIKPMDKASEALLSLKPVTFRYKKELDPDSIPQFGLVAEQVEKVNPDLVARDEQGKPYTVRYEAVNAMLLNEFLKEHRKVEEQSAAIRRLESTAMQQESLQSKVVQQQKEIQALTATLKVQAAQIQKVSDQLRTQAPRLVDN